MQSYTSSFVSLLPALTLAGGILAVILLFGMLVKPETKWLRWVDKKALLLMFIVALIATCGSLIFSEIVGWIPCKLCWFQRIFMYPQVILLGVALWRKDRKIAPYILALCLAGMIFSIIHYSEQINAVLHPASALAACDLTGVSCASTQINFAFGYITIPMMALTAFILNAVNSILMMRRSKNSANRS